MAEKGPRKNPEFDLDDDGNFPEDLTAVSRYAADVGVIVADSPADRGVVFPDPKQGDMVRQNGQILMFFSAYNATSNPGGATPAGWYPIAGRLPAVTAIRAADGDYPGGQQVGLLPLIIPDAPSGKYEFDYTVSISAVAPTRGEVRVVNSVGTVLRGPLAFDSHGPLETSAGTSPKRETARLHGHITHNGGDLRIDFQDFRAVSFGKVYKGSVGTLKYLGPS